MRVERVQTTFMNELRYGIPDIRLKFKYINLLGATYCNPRMTYCEKCTFRYVYSVDIDHVC